MGGKGESKGKEDGRAVEGKGEEGGEGIEKEVSYCYSTTLACVLNVKDKSVTN